MDEEFNNSNQTGGLGAGRSVPNSASSSSTNTSSLLEEQRQFSPANTNGSNDSTELNDSLSFNNFLKTLNQTVNELTRLLRNLPKTPSKDQLNNIESKANALSGRLNAIRQHPNSKFKEFESQNTKILDAYKILSCTLLVLRKHQKEEAIESAKKENLNEDENEYKKKFEDLKREYGLQEKIHLAEIESLKSRGTSDQFKASSAKAKSINQESYSDQINEVKKELHLIRTNYEEYKKLVDKTVSSVQILMQLPEDTTIKSLKHEISQKLKQMKQTKNNSNNNFNNNNNNNNSNNIDRSSIYLEQERIMNDKLRKEIKDITDQCIAAQTNEHQCDEENRRLRDSIVIHESQISSLLREKEELQRTVEALMKQACEFKRSGDLNDSQEKLFILQTELSSISVKHKEALDKNGRLKSKLEKSRIEVLKLSDDQAKSKVTIEQLQLDLQQSKLEFEELQQQLPNSNTNVNVNSNANINSNELKMRFSGCSAKRTEDEVAAKDEEIARLNSALDGVALQLSAQITEIKHEHEVKEKLVFFVQKLFEVISLFSRETSDLQTKVAARGIDEKTSEHLSNSIKELEEENLKYKHFMEGFSRLVSINMTPDAGVSVVRSIDLLQIDGLEALFEHSQSNPQSPPDFHRQNRNFAIPSSSSPPSSSSSFLISSSQAPSCLREHINERWRQNANEINERLFQYIEDQINILQAIASNELIIGQNLSPASSSSTSMTTSSLTSKILKSCQEADSFVKELAPSFYNEPSIFSSFGLFVDPSQLSNSLRNFLTTFKGVSTQESRELFDIAKQAIAMNSLLRSLGSLLRKESEKVYAEMQKTVDSLSEARESESSNAESRFSEKERQLNNALAQKDEASKKLEKLKLSLNRMMEKGVHIPFKLAQDLEQDGSFDLDSSDIDQMNEFDEQNKNRKYNNKFSNSSNNLNDSNDSDNLTNAENEKEVAENVAQKNEEIKKLEEKLLKSQKNVKLLKQKVLSLIKKLEKSKKRTSAASSKIQDENECLKSSLVEIRTEYEKQNEVNKQKIQKIEESMKSKFQEQQQNALRETSAQIERMKSEFKLSLKQKCFEMKEKLRKANENCENQTQRADALKKHYESLLQTLREKLNDSRQSEMIAKNDYCSLEIEYKQLKSKFSSLAVDNKMIMLKLSTVEDKTKRDSSLAENQNKLQQLAVDSKFEEKLNEVERRNKEFLLKTKEILKPYSTYEDIDSFDKIETIIKKIVCDEKDLQAKSESFAEVQNELSKIRTFISPKPNTATYFAVVSKINSLNDQIAELKSVNIDSWRIWASKIVGAREDDDQMMNEIEMKIRNCNKNKNRKNSSNNNETKANMNINSEFTDSDSVHSNEPYIKSLIGAMEAVGRKGKRDAKNGWPIFNIE